MSASLASTAPVRTASATPGGVRDLRLDYMRGLALLLIFVDHVSGNRFAAFTLQAMGFADAAEIFVFIAGLAAVYAYRRRYLSGGFREAAIAVARRVRTLYIAHLGMVAGLLLLAGAVILAGSGFDITRKLGLQPLFDDPVQALLRIPVLLYLPHYLDILPLYVLLLGTLPFVLAGLRIHALLPLAIAAVVYVGAGATGLNLPSYGAEKGWFLNPLAWALLFTAGATTAELALRGSFERLPRWLMLLLTFTAAGYAMLAFLHAAPWRAFPLLQPFVAFELALHADKASLSWHRLADIAAKAWLVAVLVPPTARFMAQGIGGAITRAGRNSLPLFIGGTYLSMLGSVILFEAGGHALAHIGVTFGGVAILLAAGWALERGVTPGTLRNAAPGSASGAALQPAPQPATR